MIFGGGQGGRGWLDGGGIRGRGRSHGSRGTGRKRRTAEQKEIGQWVKDWRWWISKAVLYIDRPI
jgi:hypothetical protein